MLFMSCIPVKPDGSIGFTQGLVLGQGYFSNCTKSFLGAKKKWVIHSCNLVTLDLTTEE